MTWLKDLALLTVKDPRAAAEQVLAHEIERPVLWMALVLATALNAPLFGMSNILFPTNMDMPLSGLFNNPLLYATVQGGGLVITVFVLTWVGGMMGGRGSLGDVLIVLTWLQFMRVGAQALVLGFAVILPALGGVLSLAILVLSIWILLHFVRAAHRFGSLGMAFLVLFLAALGISFGISIILTLIGVSAEGITPNV